MPKIAGHEFINGKCDCGRLWLDIRNTGTADIGARDIAHVGTLSATELNQILLEKTAEEDRIVNATGLIGKKVYGGI